MIIFFSHFCPFDDDFLVWFGNFFAKCNKIKFPWFHFSFITSKENKNKTKRFFCKMIDTILASSGIPKFRIYFSQFCYIFSRFFVFGCCKSHILHKKSKSNQLPWTIFFCFSKFFLEIFRDFVILMQKKFLRNQTSMFKCENFVFDCWLEQRLCC